MPRSKRCEPGAAPEASEPSLGHALPGAGQRVLYIDDDDGMVAMIERLLQRAGFRVIALTDAAAALAQLEAELAA